MVLATTVAIIGHVNSPQEVQKRILSEYYDILYVAYTKLHKK